jgi:hypothetical protein
MCTFKEQRVEPRERLAMPLRLRDGSHSLTRDISVSGLYFEIDGQHHLAGIVDFEMQLHDVGMKFIALGEIVRLEYQAGRTGVAVRLVAPRLEPLS